MRQVLLVVSLAVWLALCTSGCGGGTSTSIVAPTPTPIATPTPTPQGTTVTVLLEGFPFTAAAVQTGTGPFTSVSPQNGKITFVVPDGTNRYALAFLFAGSRGQPGGGQVTTEFVIQATTQDATTLDMGFRFGPVASATISADATQVPGAADVFVYGGLGIADNDLGVAQGLVDTSWAQGTKDIAAVAVGQIGNASDVLAVKILRGQQLPGSFNLTLTSTDAVTSQPLTLNNIPAGWVSTQTKVEFHTSAGTPVLLENNSLSQYPALPPAAVQSGDFYSYVGVAGNPSNNSFVWMESTSSGGGPVSITLPDPWTFSGPTPSSNPTFVFNYGGFSGIPATIYDAEVSWQTGLLTGIQVFSTANFQNAANTVVIPDLTPLGNGFFGCCPSGMSISWGASIKGTSVPLDLTTLLNAGPSVSFNPEAQLPSGVAIPEVQNQGSFIAP